MVRPTPLLAALSFLTLCLGFLGCASGEKREGLARVDELLTRVEQVQIESLTAREKASAAFDAYGVIVAPDFEGDPMVAFTDLVAKIEGSKLQAKKLEDTVGPMRELADSVFRAWTTDLEKFGNSSLRQASQARLAETRSRYSAVHDATVAALVSINAFNADLGDQALFLEHDFNAAAVTVIAAEVPALTNQARDLSARLNECVTASKRYIASSSLRGQLDGPKPREEPQVVVQTPAAPVRKLPNPMADGEDTAQGTTAEPAAPALVAPAKRRPRVDPNAPPVNTAPPVSAPENTQPANTQPVAQPMDNLPAPLPKPDTDLKPAPAPLPAQGGGNGGGR